MSKKLIPKKYPHSRSLAAEQLIEETKNEKIFGYVQCDIWCTENLRDNFAKFSPIFQNTLVGKTDNGDLMEK